MEKKPDKNRVFEKGGPKSKKMYPKRGAKYSIKIGFWAFEVPIILK